ncbi:MAG: L,D-transpeptidase family protein [Rhodospirillales bacterium]|nr:MAG: L,D-transpeptidase family protein [Rhodospirillales bacterium]
MTARLAALFCLVALAAATAAAREETQADRVLVDKSDRQLHLMRNGAIWKSYPIGLGFAPEGHKRQEGDGRTPEGDYVLDWRNPNSRFHLSIHISYPDAGDRADAARRSVSPGGAIFIHGHHRRWFGQKRDWTLGCIAVTDAAMDEIWRAVPDGTPITIRP